MEHANAQIPEMPSSINEMELHGARRMPRARARAVRATGTVDRAPVTRRPATFRLEMLLFAFAERQLILVRESFLARSYRHV